MASKCFGLVLVVLAGAAFLLAFSLLRGGGDQAQAQPPQFHGISILKRCDEPSKVGDTTRCLIRASYLDDFGDTITVHEAWDVVASGSGTVRVPPAGNLPIDSVSGNTTCTPGGSLPCDLGLDTGAGPGEVTFRSDTYVVQPGDPDPLTNQGTVRWQDLCDAPNTSGCNPRPDNIIQAPASTDLVHPCLEAVKECDPYTKVSDDVDYSVTIHNCSEDDVDIGIDHVEDSLAGPLPDCNGVVLGPSETCTIDYSYHVQPGDDPGPGGTLVNVVKVEGTVLPLGNPVRARAECGTAIVHPDFTVTKECLTDPVPVGEPAIFEIVVANTGDVPLNFVTDDPDIPPFTLSPGEVATFQVSRPVPPGATGVENVVNVTATLPPELGLDNVIERTASDSCGVPVVGEGCTPGFWKNNMPPWGPTGFSTFDLFEMVFGTMPDPFPTNKLRVDDPTLLEVLGARGGGINALSRHAVAALLNSAHPDIGYGLSPAEVIAAYQAALASGDPAAIEAQKDIFDEFNNAGCPVDAHGRRKTEDPPVVQQVLEACCLPDAWCEELLPEECEEKGGVPKGPGTTCEDNDNDGVADVCEEVPVADVMIVKQDLWDKELIPHVPPFYECKRGVEPPAEIPVSEQHWVCLDKLIYNEGPEPVTVTIMKTVDAPAGTEVSVHCSWDSNGDGICDEVIYIPEGVRWYKKLDTDDDGICDYKDPDTGGTAGPDGEVLTGLWIRECIAVDGLVGVGPEIPEIEVEIRDKMLDNGEEFSLEENFDVHCEEPSTHTFSFQNTVLVVDGEDPDPDNNEWASNYSVDCTTEADLEIVAQQFADLPTHLTPGVPVNITLRKTIHNDGPYGPVDISIEKTASASPNCSVDPGSMSEQLSVPVSTEHIHDETWTIECLEAGVCAFTFDNVISAKDPHVAGGDEAVPTLEVACEPVETPTPPPTPTPLPPAPGFMTGGGSVFKEDGVRVTHGFRLECDADEGPNRLQINWRKGNKFHLEDLAEAACIDDPAIEPYPPAAGFDTYMGGGTGRYNGVSGATAQWTFTDAGEPGDKDTAVILIWDADGNEVLYVHNNVNRGNHQAHKGMAPPPEETPTPTVTPILPTVTPVPPTVTPPPTATPIPSPVDTDGDGFSDATEVYVGTDLLDDCPDDLSDDAWPLDIDMSTKVKVLDVLLYKPVLSGPYDARYDLNTDERVNVLDILMYGPFLGQSCTNP